jgi:hypothetical protein
MVVEAKVYDSSTLLWALCNFNQNALFLSADYASHLAGYAVKDPAFEDTDHVSMLIPGTEILHYDFLSDNKPLLQFNARKSVWELVQYAG